MDYNIHKYHKPQNEPFDIYTGRGTSPGARPAVTVEQNGQLALKRTLITIILYHDRYLTCKR